MRLAKRKYLGPIVVGIALSATPILGQTGSAPANTAKTSGTLTIGGRAATLAHALAYDAGAAKLVLITEQAVPREKVKSEMDLMRYNFEQKPVGVVLWL